MILRREILPAFAVIGMEGSTQEGEGFVARLWTKANARFDEIAPLISGTPRLWGLMTGPNRDFMPWEDGFSRGLYLAGVEAPLDAQPPEGWAKWISPAYEYAVCPMDSPDSFAQALADLAKEGLSLAGAAYDHNADGQSLVYLPIRRLSGRRATRGGPAPCFPADGTSAGKHGAMGAPVGPHGRAIGPRRSAPGPDRPSKNYYQFRPASSSS